MTDVRHAGAAAADVPAVLGLLEQNGLPTAGVEENFARFMVARRDGKVVGCVGLEAYGANGLLRSLAVDPANRGAGVGAALVRAIMARATGEHLSALYLLTTTAADYFGRFGFAVCPRAEAPEGVRDSWEFHVGCPATAVFMRLSLES